MFGCLSASLARIRVRKKCLDVCCAALRSLRLEFIRSQWTFNAKKAHLRVALSVSAVSWGFSFAVFAGWAISGFLVLGSIILVGRFTTHCWNSWSKKKKKNRKRLNKETFKSNKTCFGLNLEGVKITQCAIDWVVSRILLGLFSPHCRCVCVYVLSRRASEHFSRARLKAYL